MCLGVAGVRQGQGKNVGLEEDAGEDQSESKYLDAGSILGSTWEHPVKLRQEVRVSEGEG